MRSHTSTPGQTVPVFCPASSEHASDKEFYSHLDEAQKMRSYRRKEDYLPPCPSLLLKPLRLKCYFSHGGTLLLCHMSLHIPLFNIFSGSFFFHVRKTIKTNKQQQQNRNKLQKMPSACSNLKDAGTPGASAPCCSSLKVPETVTYFLGPQMIYIICHQPAFQHWPGRHSGAFCCYF